MKTNSPYSSNLGNVPSIVEEKDLSDTHDTISIILFLTYILLMCDENGIHEEEGTWVFHFSKKASRSRVNLKKPATSKVLA